jgi:hypothetical protein
VKLDDPGEFAAVHIMDRRQRTSDETGCLEAPLGFDGAVARVPRFLHDEASPKIELTSDSSLSTVKEEARQQKRKCRRDLPFNNSDWRPESNGREGR